MALKKLCTYVGCNAIVTDGTRCPLHPLPTHNPVKRDYDWSRYNNRSIYQSTRWKRLRDAYIAENPLCQCEQCSFLGLATPGEIVDHIKELKDGGDPWDWNNLQTLSHGCHNRKTGEEVRKRRKKRELGGFGTLSDF